MPFGIRIVESPAVAEGEMLLMDEHAVREIMDLPLGKRPKTSEDLARHLVAAGAAIKVMGLWSATRSSPSDRSAPRR